jgi:hypothetical protein
MPSAPESFFLVDLLRSDRAMHTQSDIPAYADVIPGRKIWDLI